MGELGIAEELLDRRRILILLRGVLKVAFEVFSNCCVGPREHSMT